MIRIENQILEMTELEAREQGALPLQLFWRIHNLPPGNENEALRRGFDKLRIESAQEDFLTLSTLEDFEKKKRPAVVYKGFHLSQRFYDYPYLRPHLDVDVLVPSDTKTQYFQQLSNLDFQFDAISGEGVLFCQKSFYKKLPLSNGELVIDLHWEFSNRIFFRSILNFEELWNQGIPLQKEWEHVKVPSSVYALLIACLHPAMHHYNEFPEIWKLDIRLICERLSDQEAEQFFAIAKKKQVVTLCREALKVANASLKAFESLCSEFPVAANEPSVLFLRSGRGWRSDLWSDLKFMPSYLGKLNYLLQIAFPNSTYMFTVYLEKVTLRFPNSKFFLGDKSLIPCSVRLWMLYAFRAFFRLR